MWRIALFVSGSRWILWGFESSRMWAQEDRSPVKLQRANPEPKMQTEYYAQSEVIPFHHFIIFAVNTSPAKAESSSTSSTDDTSSSTQTVDSLLHHDFEPPKGSAEEFADQAQIRGMSFLPRTQNLWTRNIPRVLTHGQGTGIHSQIDPHDPYHARRNR